jgi:hypothetical protein
LLLTEPSFADSSSGTAMWSLIEAFDKLDFSYKLAWSEKVIELMCILNKVFNN